ncbi:MAG: 3,4-dehydroadipyl-CoA semialdehyde dehydrogenase [Deltaproteobacteria bacterium]|nr:3,4-dehydroadipyl-CoA semialdehyde dehydrogenase [Deltaproteobacteria bacterium]
MQKIESHLAGEWCSGTSEGAALVNPATEEVVATSSTDGLDFAKGLAFAREEGGAALRKMTFAERGELLQRMSDALQAEREPLIDSAIVNGGCTRGDAKFDVDGAIGVLAYYARLGKELGDVRVLPDGEGMALARGARFWGQHVWLPRRGVAVLVNAFNFPSWGFAEKAACSILGGMPVVTKPATSTALTSYLCTKAIVEQAKLPAGVYSFVGGSPGDMLEHLGVQDILSFTGSASTGQKLRSMAAVIKNSVPVNVEADSLNAAVLGPDVDIGSDAWDLFIKDVSREMSQKTGQKCTAVRRIFVPADKVADVIDALGARLDDVQIGDPSLKEVRMGPLASAAQLRDVRAGLGKLMEDADVAYGDPAAPIEGPGITAGKGYFFPKLILKARDSHGAKYVHDLEVFGPVATVCAYSGEAEDAAALVARGQGGLVASIYTDDNRFAEDMMMGVAPFHGRLYFGSSKIVDQALGSGLVLPMCCHGGPGRAGGGEELGGMRGVNHFMQRTAIQGNRAMVQAITGTKE